MARITVEDCLEYERNRFSLVLLASRRAKAILNGRTPVCDTKGNKSVVSALREIADGKVRFCYGDDVSALSIPSETGKAIASDSLSADSNEGEGMEIPAGFSEEEPETH